MKVIRSSIFETNSSSSHSISLSYGKEWGPELMRNPNKEISYLDVLSIPVCQEGYAYGEVYKLRIVIALISELIDDEYRSECLKLWQEKNNLVNSIRIDWNAYYAYYNKKQKSKGALNYMLNHSYWKYLNNLLKKKLNINIKIYPTLDYMPFISTPVDYGLGCESDKHYKELGIYSKMTKERFQKVIEEIVFDNDVCIEQYTSERC